MAWYWVATLLFGTALGLMTLGVPVAIGFFVTNVLAAWFFMGGGPGIQQVINNGFGAMTNFALVPIPMFLLMGELFYHTGLAGRCFNAADKLLGNVRGRLAYVTLIGGTAYAGPAGSSMGACALLGRLMAPENDFNHVLIARGAKQIADAGGSVQLGAAVGSTTVQPQIRTPYMTASTSPGITPAISRSPTSVWPSVASSTVSAEGGMITASPPTPMIGPIDRYLL